ncbi:MAG: class I tRNA ligase family protein, partial [Hadesarchaea archaeon]|nr:class I tRNA ligase family protein [Hadesarchaea archaeon]
EELRPPDKWILSRLNNLVKESTELMNDFQFNHVLREIRTFVWHEFCDMYIEEVKHRLYGDDSSAGAARKTLYQVLWTVTRLLAPFIPHFTEELYHTHFASEHSQKSIHQFDWPTPEETLIDEKAEELGLMMNEIVSAIRQYKSDQDLPLSEDISLLEVYAEKEKDLDHLKEISKDISGTLNIEEINLKKEELKENLQIINLPELGVKLGIKE